MKEIVWEGNSRAILRGFPDGVRRDLGTGLMYLQFGSIPSDTKPFKTGMPGTWELRSRDASGQYRVIYVCIVNEQVNVLHCFKKKAAKTSQLDVEISLMRFKALKQRTRW